MKVFHSCALLALLVTQAFADLPERSLRLELSLNKFRSYSPPYSLYLCNYGTGTVAVTTIPRGNVIKKASTNDWVVQWSISTDWPWQVAVGTNKFGIVRDEDQKQIVTLHHMEATELTTSRGVGRKEWWESLPANGTVTFVYDISTAYGTRFDVWSGRLETTPFAVREGKLALLSDDLEPSTTAGVGAIPVAIGAAREDVISQHGEPTYWVQPKYAHTTSAFYRSEDFNFQCTFFTNKTGKCILGEMTYSMGKIDEALRETLIQRVLKTHSSGCEWTKEISDNKRERFVQNYNRTGARATLALSCFIVTLDEYTTFVAEEQKRQSVEQAERLSNAIKEH